MPGVWRASRINRRELLVAGAGVGIAIGLRSPAAKAAPARLDFTSLGAGDGWPGWRCPGVANLRRGDGLGLLEAGSDVFPCDPRPGAVALDRRFRDGEIQATLRAAGAGAGVVLRRTSPRDYYAAIYDSEEGALILVRRRPDGVQELARTPAIQPAGTFRLSLRARGAGPTVLTAWLDGGAGVPLTIEGKDGATALQRAGDPGVLATARTVFPSQGPPVLPALGNLHLLPYGVQEGEAVMQSPVGQAVVDEIRERSTAAFGEIVTRTAERPRASAASAVAATTGPPVRGGALLRVASDLPATVRIEISSDPGFRRSRTLPPLKTGPFDGAFARV